MELRIADISWDTDGADVDLPEELVIDTVAEGISDPAAEIADWLSDRYGWCVNSFSSGPVAETDQPAGCAPR